MTIKIEIECAFCGKPVELSIEAKDGCMAAIEIDAWLTCSECAEDQYRESKEYWGTVDFWRKNIQPAKFSGTTIDRQV